jgi:hypothetical protein
MKIFIENRYNNFHLINRTVNKWSDDWNKYPGLPLVFKFESLLIPHIDDLHEFLQQKWFYSLYISLVYIVIIFSLKKWMSSYKTGFNLRIPLSIWSSTLAIFSIFGVIRCLPEFIHVLINDGFVASFCNSSFYRVSHTFKYSVKHIKKILKINHF